MTARDAAATRARILDAARAEFAEHGPAGARVDRIAATAPANKERIYAYFGSKAALFERVLASSIEEWLSAVTFTPDDLPGYAVALYDHFVERPADLRLIQWGQLASPRIHGIDERALALLEERASVVAARQSDGSIATEWAPFDLFAVVFGVVTAWMTIPDAAAVRAPDGADADEERVRRRHLVAMTVRRLIR